MVGFWKLQVVQSGHFVDLAERNRVRSIPIIAPRGPMLDREGRVLVDSYPSFSILLMRDDLKSLCKNTPFDEARFSGRVMRTIVGGRTVYEHV